jgi:4-amino-4-deoxy-L-arabinose transferase-like glycosyltransferase
MALVGIRAPLARSAAFSHPSILRVKGLASGALSDVMLVSAVAVLAGAIRWPNLLLVPQFSSGGEAIQMALDVADGRAFYLREVSPYIGTPYLWILALVFRLFGPSVEATMLVTWTIGALTIVPTYLLGREIGGRTVGSIAAVLLAASPAHTVITSHVPISHSLTPLISTTVLWLVSRAVNRVGGDQRRGGRLLALAGLLSGIALQTHPTSVPLLAGTAFGVVLVQRQWLRTRWPALALAMAVLGYSTLLVYHETSGFEIVTDIQQKQSRYLDVGHGAESTSVAEVYPDNLQQLLVSTARLLGGMLEDRERISDYLLDPWVFAPSAVALAGLVVAIRRRASWMVVAIVVAMVVPPAFSGKYRPILDGRFLMPLVPILFVAIALAADGAVRAVVSAADRRLKSDPVWTRLARWSAYGALVGGTVLFSVHATNVLDVFYKNSIEDGFSNGGYLSALTQLRAARRDDEAVLLDPLLFEVKTPGGGKALSTFSWLLAVSRIPVETLADGTDVRALDGHLAILHRATAAALADSVTLEPLDGKRTGGGKSGPSFRAYRVSTVSPAGASAPGPTRC